MPQSSMPVPQSSSLPVPLRQVVIEAALQSVRLQLISKPRAEGLKAALGALETYLGSLPDAVPLLFLRGAILDDLGRNHDARNAYLAVLERMPEHRTALNNLGTRMLLDGDRLQAGRLYLEAVARYPDDPVSRTNLGIFFLRNRQLERAREHLERAFNLDPSYRQAHIALSLVLGELGETVRAEAHRRAAFHGRCVVALPYRGEQPPITVLHLLPAKIGGGVRMEDFLSDRLFKVYTVAMEFYEPGMLLPPHDLIVNAVGDADLNPDALAAAQSLLQHTAAPILNSPAAVLRTSRCEVAARLAAVPGVVTARTLNLSRESLAAPDAEITLARHGFVFPLLLRAPGFHGGKHFLRVEAAADLAAALTELPGEELTAIEYLDARGADGKSRKYRVMMVDGRLYPLHLAISGNWKIHYFSAEMANSADHRAEDGAFLADMEAVLGQRAIAALQQIQKVLGLDYGGIDFGLNEDGEVMLFEANATMAVIPPNADPRWDYRRPAVAAINGAVVKLLQDKASSQRGEGLSESVTL